MSIHRPYNRVEEKRRLKEVEKEFYSRQGASTRKGEDHHDNLLSQKFVTLFSPADTRYSFADEIRKIPKVKPPYFDWRIYLDDNEEDVRE